MKSPVKAVSHWWHGDPDVVPCKLCGCPIQSRRGSLGQGMREHYSVVHPTELEAMGGAS